MANLFHVMLCFTMLVPAIVCDYQLEVTLITYNNSQGRLQDGSCCDLSTSRGCSPADTCDTRLTFSVQNFNMLTTFHSQTKVLETYQDTDVINFTNCSTLINGVRNPLTFIVPTSQWRAGQSLRLQAAIADVDRDPLTGSLQLPPILGTTPIATISRPAAPSATFTSTQTFNGANSLTLSYQYRVICTSGTCGSDCSQTTNCQPFPSCVPITCADQPCLNGGTCRNVSGGYVCTCLSQCNTPPNCAMCDDPCSPRNPCFNGGTCNPQELSHTCTCTPQYTGDTCTDLVMDMSDMTTAPDAMTTYTGPNTSNGSNGLVAQMTTQKLDQQTDKGAPLVASLAVVCVLMIILFFLFY